MWGDGANRWRGGEVMIHLVAVSRFFAAVSRHSRHRRPGHWIFWRLNITLEVKRAHSRSYISPAIKWKLLTPDALTTHSFIQTIKLKKWASIGEIHSAARRLPIRYIRELLHYRARTLFVPTMYTIPEDEIDGGIRHAMLHSDLGQIYDLSKEKKSLHVHTDFAKMLRKYRPCTEHYTNC